MNTQCTRPVQQMCFVQCCAIEQHGGVCSKGLMTSYTCPHLTWPHTARLCHCVQLTAWPIWPVHTAQEVGAHLNQNSLSIGHFTLACTDVCATHWIANLWRKYVVCYPNIYWILSSPHLMTYTTPEVYTPQPVHATGEGWDTNSHTSVHWPLGRQWVRAAGTHSHTLTVGTLLKPIQPLHTRTQAHSVKAI